MPENTGALTSSKNPVSIQHAPSLRISYWCSLAEHACPSWTSGSTSSCSLCSVVWCDPYFLKKLSCHMFSGLGLSFSLWLALRALICLCQWENSGVIPSFPIPAGLWKDSGPPKWTQALVRHLVGYVTPSNEKEINRHSPPQGTPDLANFIVSNLFPIYLVSLCYQVTCPVQVRVANGLECQCLHCIDFH